MKKEHKAGTTSKLVAPRKSKLAVTMGPDLGYGGKPCPRKQEKCFFFFGEMSRNNIIYELFCRFVKVKLCVLKTLKWLIRKQSPCNTKITE